MGSEIKWPGDHQRESHGCTALMKRSGTPPKPPLLLLLLLSLLLPLLHHQNAAAAQPSKRQREAQAAKARAQKVKYRRSHNFTAQTLHSASYAASLSTRQAHWLDGIPLRRALERLAACDAPPKGVSASGAIEVEEGLDPEDALLRPPLRVALLYHGHYHRRYAVRGVGANVGCCDFLAKDLRNHRAQLLWPLVARLGVRSVDIYFHTHPHCPVTDDRLVQALKPRRHEFSDTPRVLQLAMMDDDGIPVQY